jgi:hypothetical protein
VRIPVCSVLFLLGDGEALCIHVWALAEADPCLIGVTCWDMQTPIMPRHVEPISVEHGQYLDNRAISTEVVDTSKRSYQPYLE